MGADAFADECCTLSKLSASRSRARWEANCRCSSPRAPVMLTSTMIMQVRKNEAKVGTEDIDLVDPERARCQ